MCDGLTRMRHRSGMIKLIDALPELTSEILHSLVADGRQDIADQFDGLTIFRWTYDAESDAIYVYLKGQRPLNMVEQNVIGTRHGECIDIEGCEGIVVLDLDNFNRVTGIEILNRKDIEAKLKAILTKPEASGTIQEADG